MQSLPRNFNPFVLLLDPQSVIAQIERSERLEGLHRRVCRPLDKPLLGDPAVLGDETVDVTDDALAGAADDTDAPPEPAAQALAASGPGGALHND